MMKNLGISRGLIGHKHSAETRNGKHTKYHWDERKKQ